MAVTSLMDTARAQANSRPVRYMAVSVVGVAVTQVTLVICQALLDLSPVVSNVIAVSVASVPSYILNRKWVWGKTGRHHFWREVAPFWGMAFLGLLLSTVFVRFVQDHTDSTIAIMAANLSAFGVLWVLKYALLDTVLFKVAPADVRADLEASDEPPASFPA